MNLNKIIGYILLVIGLAVIIFTVYQSYNIFTAKTSAPLLFRTQIQKTPTITPTSDLQKLLNDNINQQIGQVIPAGNITTIFNLVSWSFLAVILIVAGGTVAGLGIKMVR